MNVHSYLFHGHKVTISGQETILAALQRRLGLFPPADPDAPSDLQFSYHQVADPSQFGMEPPPGPNRTVLELGPCEARYSDAAGQLHIDLPGHARARCDTQTGHVRIAYPQSAAGSVGLLSHLFFTIPLAELLKRRGLFMLHAAGLCLEGKGVLVAGASGAGKTTLAITLLRAGFGFLGDDTTFLSPHAQGMRALAFPDEIDVTGHTANFFPELGGLARNAAPPGGPKQSFSFTRFYGAMPTWECAPAILVFPRAASAHESVLTPMPKGDALIELLCNVLRTETRSAQAHLDALAALVEQCRCYRLHAGRDFEALPALLRSVLNQAAPAQSTAPR